MVESKEETVYSYLYLQADNDQSINREMHTEKGPM